MTDVVLDPRAFLSAGGRLSMSEYVEMEEAEREAFRKAVEEIEQEKAAQIVVVLFDAVMDELEAFKVAQMAEEVTP